MDPSLYPQQVKILFCKVTCSQGETILTILITRISDEHKDQLLSLKYYFEHKMIMSPNFFFTVEKLSVSQIHTTHQS